MLSITRIYFLLLLTACLTGCAASARQRPVEFAAVAAKRDLHSAEVNYRRIYKVLDGVGYLLYAAGFEFPISGQGVNTRPDKPFSHLYETARRIHYYSTDLVLSVSANNSVGCSIEYAPETIWVVFYRESLLNAAQRRKLQMLSEQVAGYLRAKLPVSYRITASFNSSPVR